ncbi:MAG: putative baseplate assembly protein [bacterium]|nr:putative baseplate assembly protein [bacterium]
MPLEAPKLDTRTFEELVREARLRIPRYTPEWTDFNDSDPGITLVQLFAWLSEMMLFQMNRVPDRNYIKFLKLLDMELAPAQPAVAQLSFTPQAGAARVDPVPRGAQIAAQSPEGGAPILFETEEGLDLIPLPLTDVQVYDGSAFTVVTPANAPDEPPFHPFGWVPQVGSALYLGFDETDPERAGSLSTARAFPRLMRLRVFLPPSAAAGPPPLVNLVWEYRAKGATRHWRRLDVYHDGSAAMSREGDVLVEGPGDVVRTAEGKLGKDSERYWLRCRIVGGGYDAGQEPEIDFLRPNTVTARNLTTVRDELLGSSEGLPDQSFTFSRRPVRPDSLRLGTEKDGAEPETWQRVDDLLVSGPRDPHYVLNPTAGELRFGDGRHGRIPVAGSRIVAYEYRYGGGAAGNLGAGLINAPWSALHGVAAVTNERPAEGGCDEQSLEELKREAPRRLRHRDRAVTAEDFATLAAETGGVAKATALPLAHPDFPESRIPGAVTVVIVPESREIPPQPSAELLEITSRRLDRHRLLGTELHLKGPRYLRVAVDVRVVADPFEAFDAVALAVREKLDELLNPYNQKFGRDLFLSRFADVVLNAAGVREIVKLDLYVDGRLHESLSLPIKVPADGLVYGAEHLIDVIAIEDR